MANILIIDNDSLICDRVGSVAYQMGHQTSCAKTLITGLRKVQSAPYDIVFLEAQIAGRNSLEIMPKIRATLSAPEIIVITAFGDPDEAEHAIVNGAWDYIEKPPAKEAVKLTLIRALEYRAEKSIGKPLLNLKRNGMIGNSQRFNASLDLLSQAAGSNANVLITGETGTGKELFAKAIHANSSRASQNFVIVDCTSLPETLVESVLFGHTRGAFTGADRYQDGLIKQADKGTLFLDEIGELPLSIQKSFLRVTQEHQFRPVGGSQEIKSEFRLIAATNRNLEAMVCQGRFREDLLFRLRTLLIELPPLRECREDIRELTLFYMDALCDRFEIPPKQCSLEFSDVMTKYKWPGNVRELIQALEKALLAARDEPMLFPKHLPTHIRIQVARNSVERAPAVPAPPEGGAKASRTLPDLETLRKTTSSEMERTYLADLFAQVGGDLKKACRVSGLSRSRLYALRKKYGASPKS
jgi:two-component system NtrC family response regulator